MPEPRRATHRRLKHLEIQRVDLVDAPANPGARVVLYKRAAAPALPGRPSARRKAEHGLTFDEALLGRRMGMIDAAMFDTVGALGDAIFAILHSDAGDKPGAIRQAVQDFAGRLEGEINTLLSGAVGKVGRKIAGERLARLKEALKTLTEIVKEGEMPKDTKKKQGATRPDLVGAAPELVSYLEGLEAQLAELVAAAGGGGGGEGGDEDVLKGLDPAIRALVEQMRADTAAAKAEAGAARAEVAKAQEARERERWMTKVGVLKRLTVKADDLAPALQRLHAADAKTADLVFQALQAADAQVEKADLLARELGHAGAASGGGDEPWGKICSLADQLVAKAEKPLHRSQAIDQVLKTPEGKRLYDEYKAARPKGA